MDDMGFRGGLFSCCSPEQENYLFSSIFWATDCIVEMNKFIGSSAIPNMIINSYT